MYVYIFDISNSYRDTMGVGIRKGSVIGDFLLYALRNYNILIRRFFNYNTQRIRVFLDIYYNNIPIIIVLKPLYSGYFDLEARMYCYILVSIIIHKFGFHFFYIHRVILK